MSQNPELIYTTASIGKLKSKRGVIRLRGHVKYFLAEENRDADVLPERKRRTRLTLQTQMGEVKILVQGTEIDQDMFQKMIMNGFAINIKTDPLECLEKEEQNY